MNKLPLVLQRLLDWLMTRRLTDSVTDQCGENWIWMAKRTVTTGSGWPCSQDVPPGSARKQMKVEVRNEADPAGVETCGFHFQFCPSEISSTAQGRPHLQPMGNRSEKAHVGRLKLWSTQGYLNCPPLSVAPPPHLSPFSTQTILASICPKLLVFTFNFYI